MVILKETLNLQTAVIEQGYSFSFREGGGSVPTLPSLSTDNPVDTVWSVFYARHQQIILVVKYPELSGQKSWPVRREGGKNLLEQSSVMKRAPRRLHLGGKLIQCPQLNFLRLLWWYKKWWKVSTHHFLRRFCNYFILLLEDCHGP